MDDKKMKTTAPVPPVGADGGQPLSQKPTPSITEDNTENNPPEKDLEEMLRQMQRFNDPAYLPTISMNELYENVYRVGRRSSTAYSIPGLICSWEHPRWASRS